MIGTSNKNNYVLTESVIHVHVGDNNNIGLL